MAEAFHAGHQLDEHSELGRAAYLAFDHVTHFVGTEEGLPGIGLQLLNTERKTAIGRVDIQNNGLNNLTLFHQLRWVFDVGGPRHVRDVDEAVDAFFNFNERTEI